MEGIQARNVLTVSENQKIRIRIGFTILKYAGVLIGLLSLSRVTLFGVRPLGAAFYTALLFCGAPAAFLAPMFLLAEAAADFSLLTLCSSAVVCGVGTAGAVFYKRLKKRRVWLPAATAAIGASAVFIVGGGLLQFLMFGFLCAVFCYCVREAARPVWTEKLRYRLLETETICIGIVWGCFAAGLEGLLFFGVPVSLFCVTTAILFAAKLGGGRAAVVVGLIAGAGASIRAVDLSLLAAPAFIALAAAAFCSAPKAVMPAAAIAAHAILSFSVAVSATPALLELAATAAAGLLFVSVPSRVTRGISERFFGDKAAETVRQLINLSRAETAAALGGAAGVFRSMSESLCGSEPALPDVCGVLKGSLCVSCDNFSVCSGEPHDLALDEMMRTVLLKGRVLVGDIPPLLSDRCVRLAALVSAASAISESSRAGIQKMENDRAARRVIAEQMQGMTEVLAGLSQKLVKPVSVDRETEKRVSEECNYRGVAVLETLIGGDTVAVMMRKESFNRDGIERAVSAAMKKKHTVTKMDDTVLSGHLFVGLKPQPRFDMVFGVSGISKRPGEKSGDTHSFIKISPSRFMMALCDGMGSGSAAAEASERAIGLVEQFYRAGFDAELVLKSVNRFLSRCGGERFSALDICAVDLEKGTADIIKMGGPASYIKRKNTVERIDGAALPLGALDACAPTVVSVSLAPGDSVVLASDGVSDSFEGDRMGAAVNSIQTLNPAVLTQGLLEKSLYNTAGIPRDDATVLAAKLIAI